MLLENPYCNAARNGQMAYISPIRPSLRCKDISHRTKGHGLRSRNSRLRLLSSHSTRRYAGSCQAGYSTKGGTWALGKKHKDGHGWNCGTSRRVTTGHRSMPTLEMPFATRDAWIRKTLSAPLDSNHMQQSRVDIPQSVRHIGGVKHGPSGVRHAE